MNHEAVQALADEMKVAFDPLCHRFAVAGALRRKDHQTRIEELDIICHAKPSRAWDILPTVVIWGKMKPEDQEQGKAVLRPTHPIEGLRKVVFWFCVPGQFGGRLMERTGPNHFVATVYQKARNMGLAYREGILYDGSMMLCAETEEQFFKHLKMDWVSPSKR